MPLLGGVHASRPPKTAHRRSNDPQTSPGAPGSSKSRGVSYLGIMLGHFGRTSTQFCKVIWELLGKFLGMMGAWGNRSKAVSRTLFSPCPLLPEMRRGARPTSASEPAFATSVVEFLADLSWLTRGSHVPMGARRCSRSAGSNKIRTNLSRLEAPMTK